MEQFGSGARPESSPRPSRSVAGRFDPGNCSTSRFLASVGAVDREDETPSVAGAAVIACQRATAHTFRMKKVRTRVTVSLPRELVQRIDRSSRELRVSRSRLIEDWLAAGALAGRRRELDEELQRYYAQQPEQQRAEDLSLSRASAKASRRVRIDADEKVGW